MTGIARAGVFAGASVPAGLVLAALLLGPDSPRDAIVSGEWWILSVAAVAIALGWLAGVVFVSTLALFIWGFASRLALCTWAA